MDWHWMTESFALGLQQMSWLEALGVLMGVASVFFATRENILVFPTGIVSNIIFIYLCFVVGLYGDMGINAYYFFMSIYGWYFWSRTDDKGEVTRVTWLNGRGIMVSAVLFLLFFGLLAFSLVELTDSTVPYWDAFTTASAFVGMYLMAQKKVENWIAWIVTDLVSIPLYFHKGLVLTSLQFLLFTILAVIGLMAWIKSAKKHAID